MKGQELEYKRQECRNLEGSGTLAHVPVPVKLEEVEHVAH